MPLKNRQQQIPHGLSYLQPETGWRPKRFSSFSSIVSQVIAHRRGNRHLIEKNGWSVDPNVVANEVDNYNTRICQQMGWNDYLEGGGSLAIPFRQRSASPNQPAQPHGLAQSLGNVAAGSLALVDFVSSREEAVPEEQANARAATCAACPLNTKGNWLSIFTVPIANAIRERLRQRRDMKLSTPQDEQLGVCEACDCPLPLMIHFPLDRKLRSLSQNARKSLHENCWVLKESGQLKP